MEKEYQLTSILYVTLKHNDMPKLVDLVGLKFDELTIVDSEIVYNNDKRRMWLCVCSCGVQLRRSYKALKKCEYNFCGHETHPTKICTQCKKDKDKKTDYHKDNSRYAGVQAVCKQCKSEGYLSRGEINKRNYRNTMNDPEKKKAKYATNNKSRNKKKSIDKAKTYKLEYNQRPEVIKRRKEIHHIRKATDLNYNIKKRLRYRVRDAVKRKLKSHKYKNNSMLELLGCDIDYLITHLENTFTEGMSWDKLSELHIDHIRPCNSYDLRDADQQKDCFSYKNLQMLWWQDNLRKGKSEIG